MDLCTNLFSSDGRIKNGGELTALVVWLEIKRTETEETWNANEIYILFSEMSVLIEVVDHLSGSFKKVFRVEENAIYKEIFI